jgi:ribosomal protein S18 acetylase RimI-like enzyme
MSEPVAPPDLAHVRALEERAFNAWPALQTLVADGWLLRFADGYTKRANSLNAWQPTVRVSAMIADATALYAAKGLPLVVRLSPLAAAEDDAALAARGFVRADETLVMTMQIGPEASTRGNADARIDDRPDAAWLDGFAAANGVAPERRRVHDRMLAAIALPAGFASVRREDASVAWGLAVAERGMLGLFDIVTLPSVRRSGLGRHLVQALLDWGAEQGLVTAYLQVVATNAPAIALYRRLGFREAYRYHYRIAP